MGLLDEDLAHTTPILCEVHPDYLNYIREADCRVSIKDTRKFIGLAVRINSKFFVVPLTSQTTETRAKTAKKRRSAITTTFINLEGVEIANLLFNNMFPVPMDQITKIKIDPNVDTYLDKEERFIRKNWIAINNKAMIVYSKRYNTKSRDYEFMEKICCDFKKLEIAYDKWIESHKQNK